MKQFLQILSNHQWAVFLAVLIGIIVAFPQLYFRFDHQDIYQGVEMLLGDIEIFYQVRIQEVRDGHFALANVYLDKGKDLPYLRPPLSEIIAAGLGKIFFLDIRNTMLLGRFFFPALIFLLIYLLVYQLTKEKIIGLVSSSTILLSINLFDPYILRDLFLNHVLPSHFLSYARPISPQVHSLFFFGFFLFFWLFTQNKKWLAGVMSSIILGLSFYTYPYTWSFIYAFLGILTLIFIFQRKWLEIKNIILIILGSLVIALPYFWNFFQVSQHPLYSEAAFRTGVVETHAPQLGIVVVFLLIIFLLLFSRLDKTRYYFCLALVLTPFIVLNQQVLTGLELFSGHYHWRYHKPLAIIILLIIIFEWLVRKTEKKFIYSLAGLIIVVNLFSGLLIQMNSYNIQEDAFIQEQRHGPILSWLNSQAQQDEMVFACQSLSHIIPAYTSLNAFNSHLSGHYLVPQEYQGYIEEGIFLDYRLSGLTSQQAPEKFLKEKDKLFSHIYAEGYRKRIRKNNKLFQEKFNYLVKRYEEFLSIPLTAVFDKYNVQYVIWDTIRQPNWQLNQYEFLSEVYQANQIKIYTIK